VGVIPFYLIFIKGCQVALVKKAKRYLIENRVFRRYS
jgi:hypothetical protein